MKTLKLAIATLILACGFQAASAQVRIGFSIGTPPPRPVYVVDEPIYRETYVERPVYRHVVVEPVYRPVYYRRGYYDRPHYHHAYYRHVRYYRHY